MDPLDEFLDEISTDDHLLFIKGFKGEDRVAYQDLIDRLDDEPGNLYYLYHLAALFERRGMPIRTQIPPPPPDAPPYRAPVEDKAYLERQKKAVELEEAREWRESILKDAEVAEQGYRPPYPNLMTPDPLMDSRDVVEFPPDEQSKFHNKVTIRNHRSMFLEAMEKDGFDFSNPPPNYQPAKSDFLPEKLKLEDITGFSKMDSKLVEMYKFPLLQRFTTQQTSKGKKNQMQVFTVMGNGNGLVGLGSGKDPAFPGASAQATLRAIKNLDFVDRFENRTIWTDMEIKYGATRILMRPRPPGFGLRCSPVLHQILKAAGIKDISAKIWGSRNPIMVMQATLRMLQGGHAPLSMGNGLGGRGRTSNKGIGMRSAGDVERDRGRKLLGLRK
ncbi:hypothetical protein C8J56DRAFT_881617 [Mycena floridula]|nr:hypothetical protein C8J56DRAFT_881617 [Mycena floridula]